MRCIRTLSDIGYEYGVKLAFEFLGFGWCCVRTPRGAQEILEKAGRDNVGMVVDIAHFYIGGGLLSEIEALDPKMIFAFHLDDVEDVSKEGYTDASRVIPGLGVAPVKRCAPHSSRLAMTAPVRSSSSAPSTGRGIPRHWPTRCGPAREKKMMKFALFGAGFIGQVHGRNVAAHPHAELGYIYDVNQAAAEKLAAVTGARS